MSRRFWLGAVTLLLLAFALRLYHLDFRALWWDEGLSLFFARLDYVENARYAVRLADTNPPFYRLMLGEWMVLVGSSAFAARLFSVFAGVVTVAATMKVGREWDKTQIQNPKVALIGGVLTAASPMLIYYSQEAKAYSLVAACGMLSVLLWLRLLARPARWWLWIAYGLALAIPLGSHYITIFLIAAQVVVYVICHARPITTYQLPLTRLFPFVATLALVLAIQLPFWLLTFGGTSAAVRGETGVFEGLHGPADFFGTHLLEFAVGPGAGRWEWGAGVVVCLLVLAGLLRKKEGGRSVLPSSFFLPLTSFLISLVLFPLFLGFLLNLYHEFFFPRFLLFSVPPFLLLAAVGLAELPRRSPVGRNVGAIVTLVIGATWAGHLAKYYADPGDPAEDWRPVAAAMRGYTRPDDAAIYVWGWIPGYLHAYLPPGPEPDYYLGFYTPESLAPELEAIIANHSRLWLLDYQIDQFDVRNAAGRWLGERSALVYDQWFGTAHAALFLAADDRPPTADGREAEFANGLRMRWTPVEAEIYPGDALAISLEWIAPPGGVGRRYTVFLHGLAADGTLAFGRDSEPVNGLRPMDGWKAGETVFEARGVLLPRDLPAGEYVVEVGLYDTATGEVLKTVEGKDSEAVGKVVVR